MGELREKSDYKLVTITGIDMNAVAATPLFTVPEGKTCIITHVIIRNASIELDTANFGFGYAANEDDVIAAATLGTGLTAATLYRVVEAKDGAIKGDAADVFSIGVDIAQGAAATMDVEVFGYFF